MVENSDCHHGGHDESKCGRALRAQRTTSGTGLPGSGTIGALPIERKDHKGQDDVE